MCLQKAALSKFKKEPITTNLNFFKFLRVKAHKTIKETKKKILQN